MVKIDLITGFLGSGKTTFIRKYAEYLVSAGEKIGIIENDYGAINVDMLLLNDLKQDGIGLEMVAGGCDYDCHRRRFKTKLLTMALVGYDRVIVEPSGIFDVDEFFDLLQEDELYGRYEVSNVLTICNACLEENMSEEADYMLASQIADAGRVIFSFAKESTPERVQRTIAHIRRALQSVSCRRTFDESIFFCKDWNTLTPEDFETIRHSGYQETGYVKKYSMDSNSFTSLFFMNPEGTKEVILDAIAKLFADKETGKILRIKGFLREGDGWIEINATAEHTTVSPIETGQEILIVIGEHLNAERIDTYIRSKYSSIRTQ